MYMNRKTKCCQDISSSQLIYRFDAILIKIPASYFVDSDKLILKFIWRDKDRSCMEAHSRPYEETLSQDKNHPTIGQSGLNFLKWTRSRGRKLTISPGYCHFEEFHPR